MLSKPQTGHSLDGSVGAGAIQAGPGDNSGGLGGGSGGVAGTSGAGGSAGAIDTFWRRLKLGAVGPVATPARLHLVSPTLWVRVHGDDVGSSDFQMFVTYDAGATWQTLSSGFFAPGLIEQWFFVLGLSPTGQLLARWHMENQCPVNCTPPPNAASDKTYLMGLDEATRSWSILATFPDGFDQAVPGDASGNTSQTSGINRSTASNSKVWISGTSSAASIESWSGGESWETFTRPSMVSGELDAAPGGDLYLNTAAGASTLSVRRAGQTNWEPSLAEPVTFDRLIVDDTGPLYGIAKSGFYRRAADGSSMEAASPSVTLADGEHMMWLAGAADRSGVVMLANYVYKAVSTTITTTRHVYLSRDGGEHWLDHSDGLTDADIAEIEFDAEGRAYAILRPTTHTSEYELWISPTPDGW